MESCSTTTNNNNNGVIHRVTGQEDVALVFIDNSNIFINTQQHSARIKEYLPNVQDSCRRIDYRKLLNFACEGKRVLAGKLYGSEPPPLGKVWDAIRRTEIEVHTSKKSFQSKEKATDTALIADAVELIIEMKMSEDAEAVDRYFILFSGDRDMLPVVLKAIKHGWNVQVWGYRNSIAKDFEREKRKTENGERIEIFYMDDCFQDVTFSEPYFGEQKIPGDRSLVLSFSNSPRSLDESAKDAFVRQVIDRTSTFFRLPTQGRFLKDNEHDFLVVICPEENCSVDHQKRLSYEFNLDVFQKAGALMGKLDKCTGVKTFLEFSKHEDISLYPDMYVVNGNNIEEYEQDLIDPNLTTTTFETMRSRPKKKHTKYSDKCVYNFRCVQAERCSYSHSPQEEEYFKACAHIPGDKRYLYKSKMCSRPNCPYRATGKSYLCPFAHEAREARCLQCKKYGHLTDDCPGKG